jgi:hypothetical protein
MTGQRPANHPQRRVAALVQMVRQWPKIRSLAKECNVAEIHEFFSGLSDTYWDHHYTLTSVRSEKRMALVGETRVTDMLANVFFPLAVLFNPSRWADYEKLPGRLDNRRVRIAGMRLFGDHPLCTRLFKTVAGQQGLLQIQEDFCAHDSSDCADCLFPEQIAGGII